MPFPFQFHKRKSEIAQFLHFSTLRANRKSEIGNHWVISDFWFPITPLQVHPRAEKMEQSARPPAALPVRMYTCIHCLLFSWAINSKSGLFICLIIYPSIYSSIWLFICLFCYWFIYLFLSRPLYLYMYMYVHCTCTCTSPVVL